MDVGYVIVVSVFLICQTVSVKNFGTSPTNQWILEGVPIRVHASHFVSKDKVEFPDEIMKVMSQNNYSVSLSFNSTNSSGNVSNTSPITTSYTKEISANLGRKSAITRSEVKTRQDLLTATEIPTTRASVQKTGAFSSKLDIFRAHNLVSTPSPAQSLTGNDVFYVKKWIEKGATTSGIESEEVTKLIPEKYEEAPVTPLNSLRRIQGWQNIAKTKKLQMTGVMETTRNDVLTETATRESERAKEKMGMASTNVTGTTKGQDTTTPTRNMTGEVNNISISNVNITRIMESEITNKDVKNSTLRQLTPIGKVVGNVLPLKSIYVVTTENSATTASRDVVQTVEINDKSNTKLLINVTNLEISNNSVSRSEDRTLTEWTIQTVTESKLRSLEDTSLTPLEKTHEMKENILSYESGADVASKAPATTNILPTTKMNIISSDGKIMNNTTNLINTSDSVIDFKTRNENILNHILLHAQMNGERPNTTSEPFIINKKHKNVINNASGESNVTLSNRVEKIRPQISVNNKNLRIIVGETPNGTSTLIFHVNQIFGNKRRLTMRTEKANEKNETLDDKRNMVTRISETSEETYLPTDNEIVNESITERDMSTTQSVVFTQQENTLNDRNISNKSNSRIEETITKKEQIQSTKSHEQTTQNLMSNDSNASTRSTIPLISVKKIMITDHHSETGKSSKTRQILPDEKGKATTKMLNEKLAEGQSTESRVVERLHQTTTVNQTREVLHQAVEEGKSITEGFHPLSVAGPKMADKTHYSALIGSETTKSLNPESITGQGKINASSPTRSKDEKSQPEEWRTVEARHPGITEQQKTVEAFHQISIIGQTTAQLRLGTKARNSTTETLQQGAEEGKGATSPKNEEMQTQIHDAENGERQRFPETINPRNKEWRTTSKASQSATEKWQKTSEALRLGKWQGTTEALHSRIKEMKSITDGLPQETAEGQITTEAKKFHPRIEEGQMALETLLKTNEVGQKPTRIPDIGSGEWGGTTIILQNGTETEVGEINGNTGYPITEEQPTQKQSLRVENAEQTLAKQELPITTTKEDASLGKGYQQTTIDAESDGSMTDEFNSPTVSYAETGEGSTSEFETTTRKQDIVKERHTIHGRIIPEFIFRRDIKRKPQARANGRRSTKRRMRKDITAKHLPSVPFKRSAANGNLKNFGVNKSHNPRSALTTHNHLKDQRLPQQNGAMSGSIFKSIIQKFIQPTQHTNSFHRNGRATTNRPPMNFATLRKTRRNLTVNHPSTKRRTQPKTRRSQLKKSKTGKSFRNSPRGSLQKTRHPQSVKDGRLQNITQFPQKKLTVINNSSTSPNSWMLQKATMDDSISPVKLPAPWYCTPQACFESLTNDQSFVLACCQAFQRCCSQAEAISCPERGSDKNSCTPYRSQCAVDDNCRLGFKCCENTADGPPFQCCWKPKSNAKHLPNY